MDLRDVLLSFEASGQTTPPAEVGSSQNLETLCRRSSEPNRSQLLTPQWSRYGTTATTFSTDRRRQSEERNFESAQSMAALRSQLQARELELQDVLAELATSRETWEQERKMLVSERDAVISMQHDVLVQKNREIRVLAAVNTKLRAMVAKSAIGSSYEVLSSAVNPSPGESISHFDSAVTSAKEQSTSSPPSGREHSALWQTLGSLFVGNDKKSTFIPTLSPDADTAQLRPLMPHSQRQYPSNRRAPLDQTALFRPVEARFPAVVAAPANTIVPVDARHSLDSFFFRRNIPPADFGGLDIRCSRSTSSEVVSSVSGTARERRKEKEEEEDDDEGLPKKKEAAPAASAFSQKQSARIAHLRSELDKMTRMRSTLEGILSP